MQTTNIESILTMFRGIGEKDAHLATESMHPVKYKQHNPGAADGIQGMKEWIAQHLQENSYLTTIRAFQDGPYVFTQAKGVGAHPYVAFDIYYEHWVFREDAASANKSGHTQIDGPTEAKRHEDTEKNESFVRSYYETIHIGGGHSKIPQYISEDHIRRAWISAHSTKPGNLPE